MLVSVCQPQVVESYRCELERCALETSNNNGVSLTVLALTFHVEGRDWGMMRDLLTHKPEAWLHDFKGFSQNWIKGFSCSLIDLRILAKTEDCNETKLPTVVLFLYSKVHNVVTLGQLCDLLKHADWLIQPYWHGDLGYVFSNRSLNDGPDTVTLVFRCQSRQNISHSHCVADRYASKAHISRLGRLRQQMNWLEVSSYYQLTSILMLSHKLHVVVLEVSIGFFKQVLIRVLDNIVRLQQLRLLQKGYLAIALTVTYRQALRCDIGCIRLIVLGQLAIWLDLATLVSIHIYWWLRYDISFNICSQR